MSGITEQVGRVVGGRYRLLAPIGAGASSQVFVAVDTRLRRRVAVKVLHPRLESDETFLRLFRAEARFAASLDHPHVMRVFDWGEEPGGPYLVLELLTGGSLRSLLDTGVRLDHAQAAALGQRAAAGLAYAHRRGIIHRDIKPGNLLFDEEGHVRIGDFGVARAIAGASSTEPLGSIFGTARYTSPEQATGGRLDEHTDVYSLALVLYETLTGTVPFSAETVAATLAARVGATLPPARELGPLAGILVEAAIPESFARLDASALASELEQLERELPPAAPLPLVRLDLPPSLAGLEANDTTEPVPSHAGASTATEVIAAVPPAGGGQEGELPATPPRPHRRRKRLLAIFAGAVVLLGLLGVLAAFLIVHFVYYSHVVPDIVGENVVTARAVVLDNGLRFEISKVRYSKYAKDEIVSQSIRPGGREKRGTVVFAVESKGPRPVGVPDVSGLPEAKAEADVKDQKLVPAVTKEYSETVPAGYVVSSEPSSGKELPGKKVLLYVSEGPHPRVVPDLYKEPLATAEEHLAELKLGYHVASEQYSTTVPEGDVISESPSASSTVARGRVIVLVVSRGQPYEKVPNLEGQSLQTAEGELAAEGLSWQVYGPSFGQTVVDSVPGSGSELRRGQQVTLYVI